MNRFLLMPVFVFLLAATARGENYCFEEAGARYGINPVILRSIAKVESNYQQRAINWNTNGSYDFGVMQINSSWANTLGLEKWNTLGDVCSNIMTGAWILRNCMDTYGYSWQAIGCYNSRTPEKRDRYARKVFEQLQRIQKAEDEEARKKAASAATPSRKTSAPAAERLAAETVAASENPS